MAQRIAHTVSADGAVAANQAIDLAQIIGEFGTILRVTKLPGGFAESDSHHSFSLALISYDIAVKYLPELDSRKMVMYALVHDLLELVTGDENTLFSDADAHARKQAREKEAIADLNQKLKDYPELLRLLHQYEEKSDIEAISVYWLDKSTTVWTHFSDNGNNLKHLGINTKSEIDIWYERLLEKLYRNSPMMPPQIIQDILKHSFVRMREELIEK